MQVPSSGTRHTPGISAGGGHEPETTKGGSSSVQRVDDTSHPSQTGSPAGDLSQSVLSSHEKTNSDHIEEHTMTKEAPAAGELIQPGLNHHEPEPESPDMAPGPAKTVIAVEGPHSSRERHGTMLSPEESVPNDMSMVQEDSMSMSATGTPTAPQSGRWQYGSLDRGITADTPQTAYTETDLNEGQLLESEIASAADGPVGIPRTSQSVTLQTIPSSAVQHSHAVQQPTLNSNALDATSGPTVYASSHPFGKTDSALPSRDNSGATLHRTRLVGTGPLPTVATTYDNQAISADTNAERSSPTGNSGQSTRPVDSFFSWTTLDETLGKDSIVSRTTEDTGKTAMMSMTLKSSTDGTAKPSNARASCVYRWKTGWAASFTGAIVTLLVYI